MPRELYPLLCMLMKLKQRKNKTYLGKYIKYNTYMISILIVNDTLLKGSATLLYSYLEVSSKVWGFWETAHLPLPSAIILP